MSCPVCNSDKHRQCCKFCRKAIDLSRPTRITDAGFCSGRCHALAGNVRPAPKKRKRASIDRAAAEARADALFASMQTPEGKAAAKRAGEEILKLGAAGIRKVCAHWITKCDICATRLGCCGCPLERWEAPEVRVGRCHACSLRPPLPPSRTPITCAVCADLPAVCMDALGRDDRLVPACARCIAGHPRQVSYTISTAATRSEREKRGKNHSH